MVAKAKTTKKVRFEFPAPGASRVMLVGDFTDWEPKRMTRSRSDAAAFVATVALEPGRYEYKYLVDDEWREDPHAECVTNAFGTANSVVKVQ